VTLPTQKVSEFTAALKISGTDLKPVAVAQPESVLKPGANGVLVLKVDDAETHGGVHSEEKGGQPNFGFWDSGDDWVSWKVQLEKPGVYQVTTETAGTNASEFVVEAAGASVTGTAVVTSGWDEFKPVAVGKLEIAKTGTVEIKVRPKDKAAWKPVNMRALKLTPAP
jgi:alpha-L-fucosidase